MTNELEHNIKELTTRIDILQEQLDNLKKKLEKYETDHKHVDPDLMVGFEST